MAFKVLLALATTAVLAGNAQAKQMIQGSDTMAGLMTDAILAAGMNDVIGYAGGGSGNGETAMVRGEQGISAMSREAKKEAVLALSAKGVTLKPHVVAIDGLGIFVNGANKLAGLTLENIKDIYTCKITSWSQVAGASERGNIKVYRRNDQSGTTDTFKHLVGVKEFGSCVTVLNETADIAERTATEQTAIGYSGLSAKRAKNAIVPVAAKAGERFVSPTAATVRSHAYPLARNLYIYEVSGSVKPNTVEKQLLGKLLDRSFLDPIVQANEFFTID